MALDSINRKETLYIARNNYKSYVQIKICIVMYNVVPKKSTYNDLENICFFPKWPIHQRNCQQNEKFVLKTLFSTQGSLSILRSIIHRHSNSLHEMYGSEEKTCCKGLDSFYMEKFKIVNFSS